MARGKKNVTVNEDAKTEAMEEKKPVRRGRPKKSFTVPEETQATVAEPVTEAPADIAEEKKEPVRRGRRKKTETIGTEKKETAKKEPTRRGRRKKVETVEVETAENTNTSTNTEIKMSVQYRGHEIEQKEMIAKVEAAWREEGNTASIQTIEMYVKPEDGKIYYVVNGLAGSCDLF